VLLFDSAFAKGVAAVDMLMGLSLLNLSNGGGRAAGGLAVNCPTLAYG